MCNELLPISSVRPDESSRLPGLEAADEESLGVYTKWLNHDDSGRLVVSQPSPHDHEK